MEHNVDLVFFRRGNDRNFSVRMGLYLLLAFWAWPVALPSGAEASAGKKRMPNVYASEA